MSLNQNNIPYLLNQEKVMNSTFILRKSNSAKLLFFTLLICVSCGHYYDSMTKQPLLKNEIKKILRFIALNGKIDY